MNETVISLPNGDFEVKPSYALYQIARNFLRDNIPLPQHLLRSPENFLKMQTHFNKAGEDLRIPDAELKRRLEDLKQKAA